MYRTPSPTGSSNHPPIHLSRFPPWNEDACKIGMCGTAAPGEDLSVLGVYNSTAFGTVLQRERSKFNRLYKRKAMLHHYTEFVDASVIDDAEKLIVDLIGDYNDIEANTFEGSSGGRLDAKYGNGAVDTSHLFPSF